ncbi:hypothetical protein H5410_030663 [Solanum commersonii]|uniref:Uncharacterized protein n=1 Tax=Solanum commersonii TaxID=4109 RepID=A0A9J5YGU6_SOLCO|nr:hypothetical protein H5410_030663 [Solanum commersonii]
MNNYCVNGFKFQTEDVSRNKKTNNSGVYIKSEVDGTGQTIEYYGVSHKIIKVRYSDVVYQNDVEIVHQQVDVELETTLQHPQHILEEVSDDEIMNVEEEISENEQNESFDDEEWMSSGRDSDRDREHLGVSQTNKGKTKKSMRPIDSEDIPGSISSTLERINHDTHLFAILFEALPPQRYEDLPLQAIRRPRPLSAGRISDDTPSPTSTSPQLSAIRIGDSSSKQSLAMASTPPLTQRFVHPGLSPSSTVHLVLH